MVGRSRANRSRLSRELICQGIAIGEHIREMRWNRRAFSLIELLVVMGIIALLLAILFPTLRRVRQQAEAVTCRKNLLSIGQSLLIYSNNNGGWMFPPSNGPLDGRPKEMYWPCLVFKPAVWNPPIL